MTIVCTLDGWFNYPLAALTQEQVDTFKSVLTYQARFAKEDGSFKTIELYEVTETHLRLPIEWVKQNYPTLFGLAEDARVATGTLVASRMPDPNHVRVKD